MGCHTWFSRPITAEEFELIKEYAPTEMYDLIGDSNENIKMGTYDKTLYESLMKSYDENIPCVHGKYWWQLGWGSSNPKLMSGQAYTHEIHGRKKLCIDVPEYGDTFRVNNYPSKVITCRRSLRKWMGKKYFDLTEKQLNKISKFFEENPDGVITFG